jgi:hypothetical protein
MDVRKFAETLLYGVSKWYSAFNIVSIFMRDENVHLISVQTLLLMD